MKLVLRLALAILTAVLQLGSNRAVGRTNPTQPAIKPKSDWTVEDVMSCELAYEFTISPDCRWVAWVKSTPDKDHNRWVGNLVLSSLTEGKEILLTRSAEGCGNPKWSPDGQLIAFLSSRPVPKGKPDDKGQARIWLINPFGGEPWVLTGGERAISGFDWAGTNGIIYSAQEEPSFYEQINKAKKETSQVVEDEAHEPPVRLFKMDLKTQRVIRLTENKDRIGAFWVSPDGTRVVTIHERSLRSAYDESLKPITFLTDLRTGERKALFTDAGQRVEGVRWQRESRGFYAVSAHASNPHYSYPCILELYHYSLGADGAQKVDLDWEKGLSSADLEVTAQGFVTLLADGVRPRLARYSRLGDRWQPEWMTGVHSTNVFGFHVGKDDKTFLYEYSAPSRPSQWFRAMLDGSKIGSPVQVTRSNPQFATKRLAGSEIVHWRGALGETVEGMLYYPLDYQPGKRQPLIVDIHGGPDWLFDERWYGFPTLNHNLLTALGAFVFRPNYHGSSNYGLKWIESSLGRLNELEVEDIEKGVDDLVGRGLVDSAKLGVMGWSQGGVLTAALTVRTHRYKAAVAGDGVIDWIDYWAKSDIGGWFCGNYLGKTPLEDPMRFVRTSTFYQMGQVTTPTLIFFGSEDKRVPTEQGWMHYRALQQTGRADVRFVLFPGDGHGPSKLLHVRRALEEEVAWFQRYVFGHVKQEDGSLKPDSPLATALKLNGAKADGVRYGLHKKGKLIPETVIHGGLELGRFEVTRAQFAQFDASYAPEPGYENFPAGGISFEQAEHYCAWLTRLTGDPYRLPSHSEADSLYAESSGPENTLDYWAGGPVNPDDAEAIKTKTRALGGQAPLLKAVGSFEGSGPEEPVFDLGGNVAEWTVAADGTGHAAGGSADTPADRKARTVQPGPEYIGFRVVKGTSTNSASN